MKIRENGIPERNVWEGLFNPKNILRMLGLNSQTVDVAELGCGYGTFTIPTAKIIKGQIYALDVVLPWVFVQNRDRVSNGHRVSDFYNPVLYNLKSYQYGIVLTQ